MAYQQGVSGRKSMDNRTTTRIYYSEEKVSFG